MFELAWSQTQVDMKYLGIKSTQANLYQVMASKILFLNSTFKEREEYIKKVAEGPIYSLGIWYIRRFTYNASNSTGE